MKPNFLEINGAYYDNICVLKVGSIVVIQSDFYRVYEISIDKDCDLIAYCKPL